MGLNSAILINVARSTLHGHPSIEPAGSFNRVETFHVNYFPVELGGIAWTREEVEKEGRGEGWTFSTLDGEDRRKIREGKRGDEGKVGKVSKDRFRAWRFWKIWKISKETINL